MCECVNIDCVTSIRRTNYVLISTHTHTHWRTLRPWQLHFPGPQHLTAEYSHCNTFGTHRHSGGQTDGRGEGEGEVANLRDGESDCNVI